jgi:hypothetical protein
MRRLIPLLLLLAIGTASASGVLNVLLGGGAGPLRGHLSASMVVGTSGLETGYVSPGFGTLTPAVDNNGKTVNAWYGDSLSSGTTYLQITGFASDPSKSYFTTVTVTGTGTCGFTFPSSGMTYSYTSGTGTALWEITVFDGFVNCVSQTITAVFN